MTRTKRMGPWKLIACVTAFAVAGCGVELPVLPTPIVSPTVVTIQRKGVVTTPTPPMFLDQRVGPTSTPTQDLGLGPNLFGTPGALVIGLAESTREANFTPTVPSPVVFPTRTLIPTPVFDTVSSPTPVPTLQRSTIERKSPFKIPQVPTEP